jgi:uncharacterized protein (DUF486 family)
MNQTNPLEKTPTPFDAYLNDVESRLKTLSQTEKTTEIAEIRSHLEAANEGYLAQGFSEERANALAIEEFGMPKSVAKQLIKTTWRARLKNMPQTFLGTTLFCLPMPFLMSYLCTTSVRLLSPYFLHSSMVKNNGMNPDYVNEGIKFSGCNIGLFLVFAGYLTGKFLPKHAWRSILISYAIPFFLFGYTLADGRVGEGRRLVEPIRDIGTTACLFTLFVTLWLMLPLKRYVRGLLALIPVALCVFCYFLYEKDFGTNSGQKMVADEMSSPMKSFLWVLVNPLILALALVITAFIIACTSVGVWLGRWHARSGARKRMSRA